MHQKTEAERVEREWVGANSHTQNHKKKISMKLAIIVLGFGFPGSE